MNGFAIVGLLSAAVLLYFYFYRRRRRRAAALPPPHETLAPPGRAAPADPTRPPYRPGEGDAGGGSA